VLGVVLLDIVANGVEKMGFPQARGTVDEQGVVGPAGYLGHGLGGRVGEAVRRRGDEGVEGEPGIELDRGGLPVGSGVARDRARLRRLWGPVWTGGSSGAGRLGGVSRSLTWSSTEMSPPATVAKVSWIMGKKRDDTRSRTTALGTESVRTEPSKLSGSMGESHICHVASDTCSRNDAVQRVHSPSVLSTCSSESPSGRPSTARSTGVEYSACPWRPERTPWRRSRLVALVNRA